MAHILIIDDDQDFADTIQPVLVADGHEISIIFSYNSVVRKIALKRPDLIILDVTSPEAKAASLDLARTLQKHDAFRDLPILMLTAFNDEFPFHFTAQDLDTEWFPVSDFLEKPVDFALLREKISALLTKPARKTKVIQPGRISP